MSDSAGLVVDVAEATAGDPAVVLTLDLEVAV
jgi:hypothetical protein